MNKLLTFIKEPWFGAAVGGCVGWMIVNNVPIVLGVFARNTSFSEQALAALVSLEVLGMALGVFAASWYVVLFKPNNLVRILAITHAASYLTLVASGSQYIPLAACLFAVGFTGGGLISVALAALGRLQNPALALAIFNGVAQAVSAAYSPILTYAGSGFGLAGMWYFVAITALLILPITLIGQNQEKPDAEAGPAPTPMKEVFSDWTKSSVFVGILLLGLGIYMPYAFAERMGSANNLDLSFMGYALAIGTLISIPVSTWFGFVAHKFQRRVGLALGAIPVVIGGVLFAVTDNQALYVIAASVLQSGWSIVWIVCLGAMAAIDRSGRLVVLGYFVFKLSYAIGPVAAGSIVAATGYLTLSVVAGFIILFACILFDVAERGARRAEDQKIPA
jgi:predicted MFS family arabinose efflux permease